VHPYNITKISFYYVDMALLHMYMDLDFLLSKVRGQDITQVELNSRYVICSKIYANEKYMVHIESVACFEYFLFLIFQCPKTNYFDTTIV
jgi:hypothetical protein